MRSKEVVGVSALACALAIIMSWPLASKLDSGMARLGIGDPYLHAWQVAWEGHALITDPNNFYDGNTHFPLENSLAFLDNLVGYAPMGFIGEGAAAAVARYNVLFLFAYALAFVGAYVLARELGAGLVGSLIAGAAFAYAPWRLDQNAHIIVLSSGGIPLCIALLVRGYRNRCAPIVLAGWLVGAWQMSLGFTLGLQFAYLLGALGVVCAIAWLAGGKPPLGSGVIAASAAGIALFVISSALLAMPLLEVASRHPEARRSEDEVRRYSPPPSGFLVASPDSLVWAGPTAERRDSLPWSNEKSHFPGVTIFGLALGGMVVGAASRGVRVILVAVVVVTAFLSLGLSVPWAEWVYGELLRYAPGWDAIRTPGRLFTLTSLGLALLAGLAASEIVRSLGGGRDRAEQPDGETTRRSGMGRASKVVAATILFGAVLIEGAGNYEVTFIRPPPEGLDRLPSPRVHLPTDETNDRLYTFWSIEGFPDVVNGVGGFQPNELVATRQALQTFPDPTSVDRLRSLGVQAVVLHPDLAVGTPWEGRESAPLDGLGLSSEVNPEFVVFRLEQ